MGGADLQRREALPNLVNPFWMLPLLGILKLKARDIVGYGVLQMIVHIPIVFFLCWFFARSHSLHSARPLIMNRRTGYGQSRQRRFFCACRGKDFDTAWHPASSPAPKRNGSGSSWTQDVRCRKK